MKKGALQISFAWLFSIIVGVFILFLAIILARQMLRTEPTAISAQTGKEIGALLNPLETGFESGKVTSLVFPTETRIYNGCANEGIFGKQRIKISQKNFGKWAETEINSSFVNKYIFSDKPAEGKEFYIFSKPFDFPFKVADLIYITPKSKDYCFVNSPENIQEEIKDLKQENIIFKNSPEDCGEMIKVCFNTNENCEINVDNNLKSVEKNNNPVYFEGDSLMYAGIFSDADIYECQIKRLMKRTENLAILYANKANILSGKCSSVSVRDLIFLSESAKILEEGNSENLANIIRDVENIKNINEMVECRLW